MMMHVRDKIFSYVLMNLADRYLKNQTLTMNVMQTIENCLNACPAVCLFGYRFCGYLNINNSFDVCIVSVYSRYKILHRKALSSPPARRYYGYLEQFSRLHASLIVSQVGQSLETHDNEDDDDDDDNATNNYGVDIVDMIMFVTIMSLGGSC